MTNLVVPSLGESITEAIIGKWLVAIGEYVGQDEPVVDLETDKITVQLTAPAAGAVTEHTFSEGDTVKVGDVVGFLDPKAAPSAAPKSAEAAEGKAAPAQTAKPEPAKADATPTPAISTPLPERDTHGRILSPAQRRAIREGKAPAPQQSAFAAPPKVDHKEREEIVPMSPLRRKIAQHLVQAQQSSASLTTFNEVDMSAIIKMRALYKEEFLKTHDVKLGFMSFAVKASVEALKLLPGVNAEVRDSAIVFKKYYDIGIAVGTDKGLVVPVLRDCDSRSFAEVEQGIVDMAVKARTNKLILSDLLNGTFTITNGGIYGSMMSTPLLNFPQTGILGLHNIVKRAVVVGDSVEIRPMMYLALTYDHRVVDGKEAVQFLVAVKERMENPQRLLFGV